MQPMVAAQKNSGPITRSYRTAELQPGLLFSFSQLRHDLVQVEAGCFLSLRIVPESRQELAHVILCRHEEEDVVEKPVVVGVRRYVRPLIRVGRDGCRKRNVATRQITIIVGDRSAGTQGDQQIAVDTNGLTALAAATKKLRGGNTTNCPRAPIKTGLGCLTRRTKSRTAISVPAISMSTKMPVGIPRSTTFLSMLPAANT